MSQVSDGMVERTPRARSLLGCVRDVLCVELISLHGVSCPAFYRPRGAEDLQMGERGKNLRWRSPFEGAELSLSLGPILLSWQTMPGMACPLTLTGPCPGLASVRGYVPSSSIDGAGCQGAEP